MKQIRSIIVVLCMGLLAACQQAQVPTNYTQLNVQPTIYPDYLDVTVPVNIAPLHFQLAAQCDEVVTRLKTADEEVVLGGSAVCPDFDDWSALVQKAKDKSISVEMFARSGEQWHRYQPFKIYVSPDSIDPWLTFRLISPSYVTYEELTINQRCLENYDERVIYDNMLCSTETNGQCINCHYSQQGNPRRTMFHARQNFGGTMLNIDGKLTKVNLKTDSTLSAGVYPAWHPKQNVLVYSTNNTMQSFHTRDIDKIEVLDAQSDLIFYDPEKNEVSSIENDSQEFETFPCWTPDGRWLYYGSAHFVYSADTVNSAEAIGRGMEIKYSIYRKTFNPETREFGPRQMVFDAAGIDKSATLPRISPDGRWLMVALGNWGCFHIWHRDADLWMLDLQAFDQLVGVNAENTTQTINPTPAQLQEAGILRPADELNSDNVESYHTWSSSGKWVIFSSRRTDGVYTRPFIAHMDKDGHGTKPFELPCADPDFHRQFMKSYNIPEFMRGPVTLRPQQIADVLKGDVPPVKYVQHLNK
jgi:hypothetical protein